MDKTIVKSREDFCGACVVAPLLIAGGVGAFTSAKSETLLEYYDRKNYMYAIIFISLFIVILLSRLCFNCRI